MDILSLNHDSQEVTMKKFSIALLVCLMLLTLAACGGTDAPMTTDTTGTMPTILPTMDTNIPDPDTNGGTSNETWNTEPSGFGTEGTTEATGTNGTNGTNAGSAAGTK